MSSSLSVRPNLAQLAGSRHMRLAVAFLVLVTLVIVIHGNTDIYSTVGSALSRSSPGSEPGPGAGSGAKAGSSHGHSKSQPPSATHEPPGDVDWSRFAYTQYVTDKHYLCNSVMFFERLHSLKSKPDRVLMYPKSFDPSKQDNNGRVLRQARDQYNVKLVPIDIRRTGHSADTTWAESFTKLLAFNQTQYQRVLSLDSDSVVMDPPDELFLLPSCPVAMPRAYWLHPEKHILSSQVVLIEPSAQEFEQIQKKIDEANPTDYDMEIVNYLYYDSALVIPHRKYDLLTSEFRTEDHGQYLGNDWEKWDPVAAYNEAKYIHFSDWPIPKPWLTTPETKKQELQPKCKQRVDGQEECSDRNIWQNIYAEFRERRKRICGEGFITFT